ncbi:kidney disease 1-like 2 [Octopus vulgaris]|uniref:Kidney disease 1-like 2 n=1 Tax=Octopus vulgaris TaxID=6645 RepID=A0AA36AN40_OCTVU|nr:kidney disease 1-like 2 [Octopus vulgaris]
MRKSGIGCGPLSIQLTGSSGTQFENESNVMEALSTDEKFLTYDENMRSALITSPTLILSSERDKSEKTFVVEFKDKLSDMPYRKPKFVAEDQSFMFYHKFQYRSSTDYSCIKLQMEKKAILGYEVYFRLNSSPNNDTFDYRTAFNKDNLTSGDSYHFCVPVDTFEMNGTMYVGLRPFQLPGYESTNIFSKYAFKGFSVNCMAWNGTAWVNDTCKGNIWPLCDNKINDTNFYLITVFTGLKADSGTLSNICFILCGEKNTSATRCLNDGIHKGFPTGSLRKFLMSTSDSLGDLIYLRIWSDCSGYGLDSSWYLNKVEIMDTKTEKILEWGSTKSEYWLTSFAMSNLESFILIDPGKVKTVELYFDWMEKVVFPNFFPTASIFKKKMVSIEKMYISDGVNIKIGPARLRQLRVKKSENCDKSSLKIKSCNKGYNLLNELKDPYCLRWQPETVFGCPHNESVTNLTSDSWKYTPASKINGVPIIDELSATKWSTSALDQVTTPLVVSIIGPFKKAVRAEWEN